MPRTRQELEQLEKQNLAPYAQFSADTRGRKQDEVPKLLAGALLEAGVAASRFEIIPDEAAAVDAGLAHGRSTGPVCLLRSVSLTV